MYIFGNYFVYFMDEKQRNSNEFRIRFIGEGSGIQNNKTDRNDPILKDQIRGAVCLVSSIDCHKSCVRETKGKFAYRLIEHLETVDHIYRKPAFNSTVTGLTHHFTLSERNR